MIVLCSRLGVCSIKALGIEAASFANGASKDIAESPTASPERPKKKLRNSESKNLKSLLKSNINIKKDATF